MGGACGPSARFPKEKHGFVPSRDETSGFCNGKWASSGRRLPIGPRVSSRLYGDLQHSGEARGGLAVRDWGS